MVKAIEYVIAFLVFVTVVLFVPYFVSVWRLPLGRRPLTPKYDRFGREIAIEENPSYEEELPVQKKESENQ